MLDVFFVRNYYKELGYDNILQCWWLPPGRSLDGGLRALTCDGELREMCFAAQKNDRIVDVHFEHGVSTPEVIAGKEVVVWLDDTCEGDLVSKKNTSEGPKADGNMSNPTTEPNPIPNANPSPINNLIPTPLKPTINDDSSEDSSFKPIQEDSSSSEDNASMSKPRNKKLKDIKRGAYAAAKTKENIMQPNDALVEDVSDGEVDLGFVGTPGIVDVYEALDPGADSDGANSWHSEEMKTPSNSEDELQSDEDSDEFPIFRNGARFGCAWVVYASRDCDDSCLQIKTLNDDHTCARKNTNRAANRAWVASKLVKKVRKYPNFKQCEAAVYFRTKSDLMLNRNSIARALADARNVPQPLLHSLLSAATHSSLHHERKKKKQKRKRERDLQEERKRSAIEKSRRGERRSRCELAAVEPVTGAVRLHRCQLKGD
ncbi:hypothetical protein Ahy_B10g101683 [Arachis hypogaea]|uniref:PB1-like domain-containing protein n=1 Tax=Arachis hypogaea TaxID=3818 RepID=A0A444X087_ARAHY|nr:hypothetical protein Ahy_B10g101683 [Arachis hypogaea]